jgi:hypothetical protein
MKSIALLLAFTISVYLCSLLRGERIIIIINRNVMDAVLERVLDGWSNFHPVFDDILSNDEECVGSFKELNQAIYAANDATQPAAIALCGQIFLFDSTIDISGKYFVLYCPSAMSGGIPCTLDGDGEIRLFQAYQSSHTIKFDTIHFRWGTSDFGGAIQVISSDKQDSILDFYNCSFSHNSATIAAGALYLRGPGSTRFNSCRCRDNVAAMVLEWFWNAPLSTFLHDGISSPFTCFSGFYIRTRRPAEQSTVLKDTKSPCIIPSWNRIKLHKSVEEPFGSALAIAFERF